MYATLYENNTFSILDNRKFIKPNAVIYEMPPKNNLYIPDETLAEKIKYSYSDALKDKGSDVYSYQYNANWIGNRDADTGIISKLDKDVKKDVTLKLQLDESGSKRTNTIENYSHTCAPDIDGVKNVCGAGNNLYPIMDPRFNLRESAKNMILLEDHLFHSGKRCQDCILKHCLTIEALLEEGITLDLKGDSSAILIETFDEFRDIFLQLSDKIKQQNLNNNDCVGIAQKIRKIRKPLCQGYATFF